ncbi:hypothetical protein [Aeromicrobium terrae]|uniref:DUF4177 domain-containing protein n=1 Tax=Aeromicrobium terrae TaxID=2498846 RepID=A0A5C8NI90_9ACTN|nr:hypothetical protein [Aeromicrobium terrae]TXL61479.1 hypothetical protein FHP06_08620 [Aeromicrobium terrae]
MGIIKDTKVGMVASDARAAKVNGQSVFVAVFKSGGLSGGSVSGELKHISAMVEAVEAEGWTLEQASYADAGGKVDRMLGVFRPSER